jgi:alpha-beta hydrolase superfamily lysophospholipase
MRRLGRWGVRLVVGLVVVVVLGGALAWWFARPDDPDAFYDRPTDVPSASGVVVREEVLDRSVPEGASAWRVLYTSTGLDDRPTVVSATILVPDAVPEGGAERPVLAWAHGTTGVARGCAPSLLDDPWGGIPALDEALDRGWVVVATDYEGLGTEGRHPYLVGEVAARNVLDSIRAVESFAERRPEAFGDAAPGPSSVVWGHSQGGHSALFTTQLAPTYAPELDLVGGAGIAPATDLAGLLEAAEGTDAGKALTSLAMVAWADVYDDVELDGVVREPALPLVRDIASRCIIVPEALVTLIEASLIREGVLAVDPSDDPVLRARIAENTPAPSADGDATRSLFIAQGLDDEVVAPTVTEAWVEGACEAGATQVTLETYEGEDHLSIASDESPVDDALIAWSEAGFDGVATGDGGRCPR